MLVNLPTEGLQGDDDLGTAEFDVTHAMLNLLQSIDQCAETDVISTQTRIDVISTVNVGMQKKLGYMSTHIYL